MVDTTEDTTAEDTVMDTDTMVASARAYIVALNKLIVKREKQPLLSKSLIK